MKASFPQRFGSIAVYQLVSNYSCVVNRTVLIFNTDGGRKLVFGTDFGIYVTDRKPRDSSVKPKRVLDAKSVTQIDVLEQYGILLILSDKNMYSFPMEALDPEQGQGAIVKRGKKIGHANFFKVGVCVGQHLVATVKLSAISSVIKVYEPMDAVSKNKKKSGFAKMLASGQDVLKLWKVGYFVHAMLVHLRLPAVRKYIYQVTQCPFTSYERNFVLAVPKVSKSLASIR